MTELSILDLLVLAAAAIALGMYLLAKGGTWTIDAAVWLARRMGVSPLLVGFTILAFGTSLPELLVSVSANLSGYPALALGNVIGSNIANILLIIGLTAIFYAVAAEPKKQIPDAAIMLLSTALLIGFMAFGEVIARWQGGLLLAILVIYVVVQYRIQMNAREDFTLEAEADDSRFASLPAALGALLAGLVGIALGAEFLVRGAATGARVLGVPEGVIGLTIVAFGTSLPELATCLVAALRKQTDLIIGNIVGSNAFNILSIIGLTALAKPLAVDAQMAAVDMWIMGAVTLGFAAWMLTVGRVSRPVGIVMFTGYIAYVGWLAMLGAGAGA